MKNLKIPNVKYQVETWLKCNNINIVTANDESTLPMVSRSKFISFIDHSNLLYKQEIGFMDKSSNDVEFIDLESQQSPVASTSRLLTPSEIKKEKIDLPPAKVPESKAKPWQKKLEVMVKKFNELKDCFDATPRVTEGYELFSKILPICESVVELICLIKTTEISERVEVKSADRIIGEDITFEDGGYIMIEGTLPLSAAKYKNACRSLPRKVEDRQPRQVMNNIVKHCFPRHWIVDVTVHGTGGRTSLFDLWDYKYPLSTTDQGDKVPELGKNRVRALIGK